MWKKIDDLPGHFTGDACRHGGMTELEEAAFTKVRAAHYQGTRQRKRIAATPRKLSIAHRRPRGSVTLIGSRTKRPPNVRNEGRISFRIKGGSFIGGSLRHRP